MKTMFLTTLLVMLIAIPGLAQTTLNVNGTAALDGSFGLEVAFNSSTAPAFVTSTHPNDETVYRAEFKIDVNNFDFLTSLPAATPSERQQAHHLIFLMMDLNQPPGVARQHASVHLKKFDTGGGFQFKIWGRLYDPTDPLAAPDGYVYRDSLGQALEVNLPTSPAGYPVIVRVEWTAASGPGNADGTFSLTRANNFNPSLFQGKTNTTLQNDDKVITQALLGAVSGVDAGSTGSYYLDTFSSFRTLAP